MPTTKSVTESGPAHNITFQFPSHWRHHWNDFIFRLPRIDDWLVQTRLLTLGRLFFLWCHLGEKRLIPCRCCHVNLISGWKRGPRKSQAILRGKSHLQIPTSLSSLIALLSRIMAATLSLLRLPILAQYQQHSHSQSGSKLPTSTQLNYIRKDSNNQQALFNETLVRFKSAVLPVTTITLPFLLDTKVKNSTIKLLAFYIGNFRIIFITTDGLSGCACC